MQPVFVFQYPTGNVSHVLVGPVGSDPKELRSEFFRLHEGLVMSTNTSTYINHVFTRWLKTLGYEEVEFEAVKS